MQRAAWAAMAVAATCAAGVLAAVALVDDPTTTPAPATQATTAPGTGTGGLDAAPVVVTLAETTFLLTHEAATATTEFGAGTLTVEVGNPGVFRFVDSASPVDGGRMEPNKAPLAAIPQNLPVVVSFDGSSGPVSIFGRLAAAPVATGSTVAYVLTIFDAPGKDSTYTVSSAYDIPETLRNVTVAIAGQRTAE